jgi:cytochrome P450
MNDFLSGYLAAVEEAGELSPLEVIIQIVVLIVGGTDTTRVASAMQVALLLQHPEQWDAVCHNPTLIPAAVSEALRYGPSVASASRFTLEDIVIDGHTRSRPDSSLCFRPYRPCVTNAPMLTRMSSIFAVPTSAANTQSSVPGLTAASVKRSHG